MTPENFCYWLQGYFEILDADKLEGNITKNQQECIKQHLALVFEKVTKGVGVPPEIVYLPEKPGTCIDQPMIKAKDEMYCASRIDIDSYPPASC